MTLQISAFDWVPPLPQGYVRDLRPRWALEEAGLPYEVTLVTMAGSKEAAYRAWQPFGQVPACRDGEVSLFETGAILLHIAEASDVLRPRTVAERAAVHSWLFAALNTIEVYTLHLVQPGEFFPDADWVPGARRWLEKLVGDRFEALAQHVWNETWLTGRFGVADIAMVTVLRDMGDDPVLAKFPVLEEYVRRGTERPAFQAALQAQLDTFAAHAPA